MNRPDGVEVVGRENSSATRTCRISWTASAPARNRTAPFDLGFRVSIACRMAVDSYRRKRELRWDPAKEEIV